MSLTLAMITMDSADPGPLAAWWADQLGGTIVAENEGWFYVVQLIGAGYQMAFQKVDGPTAGKNRIHLDMNAPDMNAAVSKLVGAGATKVSAQEMDGFEWTVLADPQGNQFCVASGH